MYAFYWSVATVMLVGSAGTTVYEVLFSTVTIIITVVYFAYILGNISLIVDEITRKHNEFVKDYGTLEIYLKKNKVEKKIQ